MKARDIAVFGLFAAAAAYMLMQYDHHTMHVPLIMVGVLGYMYAVYNRAGLRFNPVFGAALVCVFGGSMGVYTWLLYTQGYGAPVVASFLVLAACVASGTRLVPLGMAACGAIRQTGRHM